MALLVTIEYISGGRLTGAKLLTRTLVCGLCEGEVVFDGIVLGMRYARSEMFLLIMLHVTWSSGVVWNAHMTRYPGVMWIIAHCFLRGGTGCMNGRSGVLFACMV